ncbi:MAG: hypothetical protein WD558_02045, partial [Pseudomonadales bacterium]
MGKKTVPLLKELVVKFGSEEVPLTSEEAATLLFPDESWYETFPTIASGWIPEEKLQQEVARIQEKRLEFEQCATSVGLSMLEVYLAVKCFREQFLEPGGRYFWFFERMELAHRIGSYLFLHGGVDDKTAVIMRDDGVGQINSEFKRMLRDDPFALYHGELGNTF